MNAKELLQKVKAMFELPIAPAAPVAPLVAATAYKLKDGTDISITIAGAAIAVGDTVTVAGAPAPAGDYELEDGSMLTVDATGAITAIVEFAPITQPDFVAPAAAPTATIEDRIKAIESRLGTPLTMAAIEDSLAPIQTTMEAHTTKLQDAEAKIKKQDEVITGLFDLAEKLTELPSTDPKTLNGNKKDHFDRMSARDKRLEKMGEAIKAMKTLQ